MTRFSACPALVLRMRQTGESNREAFFLTAGMGITRAFVYGGPKSRLRSYVSPFHSGGLYLYHDPVRDSYKVTDFDVRRWRPGIRENYDRTMAAVAIAETVLAGFGGGCNWGEALDQTNDSLDALDNAVGPASLRVLVHFLWKWSDLLGIHDGTSTARLSPAPLRWLEASSALPPSEVSRLGLDSASLLEAKNFCAGIIASALGRHLKSWEWQTPSVF
ncbi:MAG: recombination protein O N-terminal domain-containing protein [Spirochaetaceae bacterium]|jgi:DNA repair protein RecO (recombination protein O)|nr:recombination protein O N-terminal domain-containing protein [Spirochaetaceae bacterium]